MSAIFHSLIRKPAVKISPVTRPLNIFKLFDFFPPSVLGRRSHIEFRAEVHFEDGNSPTHKHQCCELMITTKMSYIREHKS